MRHVSWEHGDGEKGMIIKTAAAAGGSKGKMKGGEQTGERKGAMCVRSSSTSRRRRRLSHWRSKIKYYSIIER